MLVNWNGKEYEVLVDNPTTFTVGDLKADLSKQTNVLPKRMKLLGVGTPKTCVDEATLSSLKIKKKIMMMGTPETVSEPAK
jgi:hypothetical protein